MRKSGVNLQILTPHMQSTAARRINRDKRHGSDSRRLALAHAEEQAQADISLGIWKAAFKDACERLCPVRARGQKCGCLSLPGQLVFAFDQNFHYFLRHK